MNILIRSLIVTLAMPWAGFAQSPSLSDELLADGWIQLFDDHSLFGWHATNDADWRVRGGKILVSAGQPGFLMTASQFADYELHVEFRAAAGTNSGIFLRTPRFPQAPERDCYELNIAPPENPFPTGSLVGRARVELSGDDWPADDTWHAYDVTLDGPRVTVRLDGRQILQYVDPQPLTRGHIGLQLNQGKVAFRNVRLRPLGTVPLFDGQSLNGWNTERAEKSRFEINPQGELHVINGSGQIESTGTYGDFVLQLECQVNGNALNSGIFFRCIRGDKMNGYESQIHNGFEGNDRARPADYGTGGIFRRQPARRVVADDHQWFHKTIVADGPHMAVWVNGYQVSNWTDDRAPDPVILRQGSRLAPGTICIQGHDPTTDLLFRHLRISELPH